MSTSAMTHPRRTSLEWFPRNLAHLWADTDLAGLLDQEALDQLPPAERQECRALWGEIDVLIRRAQTITAQDGFRGDGSS
jgi:hypothetical protein